MRPFREHVFLMVAALLLLATLPPGCREKTRFDFDFERPEILDDLGWRCGTIYQLAPVHATSGAQSLEVTFHPCPPGDDECYPGLSLPEFDPDWSGYRSLVFDAFNPGAEALRLALRIDDRENPDYADRFNTAIPVNPGANRIAIPLAGLFTSGSKRPLNIGKIQVVTLFLVNPTQKWVIFFDRIRVE